MQSDTDPLENHVYRKGKLIRFHFSVRTCAVILDGISMEKKFLHLNADKFYNKFLNFLSTVTHSKLRDSHHYTKSNMIWI